MLKSTCLNNFVATFAHSIDDRWFSLKLKFYSLLKLNPDCITGILKRWFLWICHSDTIIKCHQSVGGYVSDCKCSLTTPFNVGLSNFKQLGFIGISPLQGTFYGIFCAWPITVFPKALSKFKYKSFFSILDECDSL